MERLTEAVNFLLRRHIKTADPTVRQEGQQHLDNIAALVSENKPVQGIAVNIQALDSASLMEHSTLIGDALQKTVVPKE